MKRCTPKVLRRTIIALECIGMRQVQPSGSTLQ